MRMRAADWYSENLSCQNIGGSCATSNVGGARCCQRAIWTVGPSQSKLKNRCSLRGETNARGLGSDQCLEVDDVEQRRLQELALEQRSTNAHQRFVRKYGGRFPDRFNIAREADGAAVGQVSGLGDVLSHRSFPRSRRPRIVGRETKKHNVGFRLQLTP